MKHPYTQIQHEMYRHPDGKKKRGIYLNHCGISPLTKVALDAMNHVNQLQFEFGSDMFQYTNDVLNEIHDAVGRLLKTDKENISFLKNTAEGFHLVSSGYPIFPGDEILTYIHEYPSNYYPWKLLEKKGAVLKHIPDENPFPDYSHYRNTQLPSGFLLISSC